MSRRVVLIANRLDVIGGIQRLIELLGHGFRSRGRDVLAVAVYGGPPRPDFAATRVLYPPWFGGAGLERFVKRVTRSTSTNRLERASRRRWSAAVKGLRAIGEEQAETVFIAMDVLSAQLLCEARPRGVRIFESHNEFTRVRRSRDYRRIVASLRVLDAFVLSTPPDRDSWLADGAAGATLIVNPIRIPGPPNYAAKERVVAALGRFEAEKSFETLLEAWALVPVEARASWVLEVYGQGSLGPALRRAVVDLGIADSATIHDPVPTVEPVLARASIVALTSRTEGFGMVLLEAMVSGAACVATNSSAGLRSLVVNEVSGLLAPVGDPAAIAVALTRLMTDSALLSRIAESGHQNSKRYALDNVISEWERLFDSISKGSPT